MTCKTDTISVLDHARRMIIWTATTTSIPGRPWNHARDCCGTEIDFYSYGDTESRFGWEIDHAIPLSRGGVDELANMVALQWRHNRSKGTMTAAEYARDLAATDEALRQLSEEPLPQMVMDGLKRLFKGSKSR